MSVWAIVPVKPFTRAKSRLAAVLSPLDRVELAEKLLRHIIATIQQVPEVTGVLVVSRDNKALAVAREAGAHTVQESGMPELNHALMRATQVVMAWRGGAVLILPADLPLVAPEDLRALVRMGDEDNSVVIAPDRAEDGTNALLVRPAGMIPYAYGPGSFQRHLELAREAKAIVRVYRTDRIMLDIDVPADLDLYRKYENGHQPEILDLPGIPPVPGA
ncbi:MAG TPA: 2-phospho-L-lactate guanylyltransferase [Candidatus Limnocylindrales bacterium]|nr:2-phospho-L-lactate guanylyltransferase [Candidatus Limnocylindrales bacterium]